MGLQNPDCGFEPHPACQFLMDTYTYSSFVSDTNKLKIQIENSPIKFDCINCVTRGGLALTAWLSQALGIRSIYTAGGKFEGREFIYSSNMSDDLYGNVLIVSDLCRSGQIIKKIRDDILLIHRVNLAKIACLHYYPDTSIIRPDFFAGEAFSEFYLKYPWEQ